MPKVLIVEDDAQTSAQVTKALSGKGYRTRVESNGAAALLAAHDDLPDLILMDQMMPILEGQETLHALRNDPHTAHIPVIILSARTEDTALAGAVTAGANLFLTKPLDLRVLLMSVERLVALKPKDVPG